MSTAPKVFRALQMRHSIGKIRFALKIEMARTKKKCLASAHRRTNSHYFPPKIFFKLRTVGYYRIMMSGIVF